MSALAVLAALLETEDNFDSMFDRYAKAIAKERGQNEALITLNFKRAVAAYIKWAHTDYEDDGFGRRSSVQHYDPDDLKRLRQAKTFSEAEQILAEYDRPDVCFLSMVDQGYFT